MTLGDFQIVTPEEEAIYRHIAEQSLLEGIVCLATPMLNVGDEQFGLFINPRANVYIANEWDYYSSLLGRRGLLLKHYTEAIDDRRYMVITKPAQPVPDKKWYQLWK